MAIAHFPNVVLDCPEPSQLATFYGALLGWETSGEGDWLMIKPADGSNCISFQRASGYQPPEWPGQDKPQQLHLDFDVDDLDAGEAEALSLGATKAEFQPGTTFRVFLDPAGHPFCLCSS